MSISRQFEIKKRETFEQGIHRLLEQLNTDTAKLLMSGSRAHLSVHEARKNIKKLRAILRLIRHEIDIETYQELNAFYREIAQQIGPVRDVTSQIELFEKFETNIKSPALRRAIEKAIRLTKNRRKKEFDIYYKNKVREKVAKELLLKTETFKQLNIHGESDIFIEKSVRDIFKKTIQRMKIAEKDGGNEAYHNWRKTVKYFMFQMMILKNAWASYFEAYIGEMNEMQKLLGDLHDLNIVNNFVVEGELFQLDKKQKDALLNYIYPRRAALKKQIHQIGNRLFIEDSLTFASRLNAIWKNSAMVKQNLKN